MATTHAVGGKKTGKSVKTVTEPAETPLVMNGLKGQLLRFGEHNIAHLRRELHAAVDEEVRFTTGEQKDVRKQLLDKVLVGLLQMTKMEDTINDHKLVIKKLNQDMVDKKDCVNIHQNRVTSLEAEKKINHERITALKREKGDMERHSAMQDSELADMKSKFEPYKKQNAMLMNIIQAAEKGHNMLLGTMSDINKEIAGTL